MPVSKLAKKQKMFQTIYAVCSELKDYAQQNACKDFQVDFYKNRYFDYEDEEIIERYKIWYNNKSLFQNLEFHQYLGQLKDKYKTYDYDIAIHYNSDKNLDLHHQDFANINARTLKNLELNIYEILTEQQKADIAQEAQQLQSTIDGAAFKILKQQAQNCINLDYQKFHRAIKEFANQINREHKGFLGNIRSFLAEYGIALLCQSKKPHPCIDGLSGFACNGSIPTIIVYSNYKKDLRRIFFTIGHELYHLLFDDNEDFANKFGGYLLLTQEQLDTTKPLQTNQQIEQTLVETYKKYKISMQCIINTLYNYNLISKEQRKYHLGDGKLNKLVNNHCLPNDDIDFIQKSIGLKQ